MSKSRIRRFILSMSIVAVALGLILTSTGNVIAGGVLHRVTAGGQDGCEAFGQDLGCDGNWSLVAMEFDDGSVTGQLEDRLNGLNGYHGTVNCLFVSGNQAWIGGVITSEFENGDEFLVTVVDHGNSANDPPDEISFTVTGDPIGFDCVTVVGIFRALNFIFEVPQGQVKVK